MAGTIKANAVQLGDSATASQNFVLQTNVDGSAKLSRGNLGATTQDILTVDAAGEVTLPNTVIAGTGPCFSAWQSSSQNLSAGATTKIVFQSVDSQFPNNGFAVGVSGGDALSRFTPNVAGYYQISGGFTVATSYTGGAINIFKNGSINKHGISNVGGSNTTANAWAMSALVYLNGTTDYVELYGASLVAQGLSTGPAATYFQGFLARAA